MNSLKRIMIEHGEKIALMAVVLVCAWSVYGMLSKDPDVLDLPGGRQQKIDPQDLSRKIKMAKRHLQSGVKVMPNPEAEKVSYKLAARILSAREVDSKVNFEWFAYVQPPAIGLPQLVQRPAKVKFVNVPEEYRTMTGNPQDVRVISTVDRVLIICRDSKFNNYIAPGSRAMMLWRKAIGSGRSGISAAIVKKMLSSPRSESVKVLADEAAGTETQPTADAGDGAPAPVAAGFGFNFATPAADTDNQGGDLDASKYTLQRYKEKNAEDDRRAALDMTVACTRDSVMKTGWETITPKMRVMTVEPDSEVIKTLLTEGYTPDIVEMTDAEKAAYKKKNATRATTPAATPANPNNTGAWEGIVDTKPTTTATPAGDEGEEDKAEQSDERYYVFIDENIQQNMVYRYGVIASIGVQSPPEEILKEEKHSGWNQYATVEGINGIPPGGGVFAPPLRVAEPVFKNKMPEKSIGVKGYRFEFTTAYLTGRAAAEETPTVTDAGADGTAEKVDTGPDVNTAALREDNGGLTELGWAYKKKEPCFSDFVYTDLVITPKEYDIDLIAAFPELNGTPAQATLRLYKVQPDGTVAQTTALVNPSKQVTEIVWSDFLKKGSDGKALWPPVDLAGKKITPTSEMPLAQVYDKLGKQLQITPIKAQKRIDGKIVEFDTGWGLVDVRKIIIKGKRFRIKDGVLTPIAGGDIMPLEQYSVVIAETNPPAGQPRRFKRLYREFPDKTSKNIKTVYQTILEPELVTKIGERMKREQKRGGQ